MIPEQVFVGFNFSFAIRLECKPMDSQLCLHDKGGERGPRLKQIRMVATLAQLHQHVDHGQKVAAVQRLPGLGPRHKVVVEEALTLGQRALDQVLVLLGQLFLNLALQPA